MNRFSNTRPEHPVVRQLAMPVAFFAAVFLLFFYGLRSADAATQNERLEGTRRAVLRAVVHCYAVEGVYPPGLEYLEENYGLSIDRETFVVDYRPIASNLMPDITVIPKNGAPQLQ